MAIAANNEQSGATPVKVQLVIPLAPGVNRQYATVGRRRVLTAAARTFNRDVRKIVERAWLDGVVTEETERQLRSSLLGVYLTFYFETPHRRDLDGGLKITLDAVCTSLGLDDRSVVDLHLTKQIDPLHPRTEIEIETISDWSFDRAYVYLGEETESGDAGLDAI